MDGTYQQPLGVADDDRAVSEGIPTGDELARDLALSMKALATDITGTLKNAPATQNAPRKTQTSEQAIATMVTNPPNKVPTSELTCRLFCAIRSESIWDPCD